MKTLSKAVAMASLLSAGVMGAQVANAEVEYSAGLASTYLWRGQDLGGAAFSASATYSHESGAYAGLWASSGDTAMGTEYDLYVGYGMAFGDVSVDLSVATYTYNNGTDDNGADTLGSPGELSEAVLNVGYMGASVNYIDDLGSEYTYITLGYGADSYSVSYSMSDDGAGAEYSVIDFGLSLTDELSLAVAMPIDDTAGVDEDTIVSFSYTLPIK